ncbi:hypothetical protein SPRG_05019 [Saprolegnia parasitica CBS 223.65]|uniref:ABC transporter domain-containing protein n=1 Tax=Saprolegnia parasitica (strain CBS 223.65) TaxID=695850 RepID=A0A067CUW0_SAPPC|nr:hypothetical protein SPRG_05019 [Saprolegnia parasitica CBS 223.65]KDO30306.1 hypothetical protein SPRG_05019 [Saprolegnia parasitica CBS 223.65]|eukprot:XP_012198919.1 hypothetical protein SPRG_05019 [Saprolegnia parasitica CBS 223.65]
MSAPTTTTTIPQTADEFLVDGSEAFHERMAAQLEAAMAKPLPQMEIRFQNLSVAADVQVATKDGHELPTLYNQGKKAIMRLFHTKRVIRKDVLHPMTGVFKPRTMTLVLGQPNSGKSSLMKILSGRFPMHKNILVGGQITYNGVASADLQHTLPQFASYVSQLDFHYAVLTVKETLAFAHACSGGNLVSQRVLDSLQNGSPDQVAEATALIHALYRAYPGIISHQMGLDICKDTILGNAMLRGVSGGERKRVTVGEMEFGMKQVSFMDEISTGLDSAATYDIVKSQKSMAESLKKTIVIALLQPSPELYNLFDEVLLLNEGHVMYHGPRSAALEYFESLGFKCPPKRDVADFLLDLGTPQQDQYVVDGATSVPRLPSEYADIFRRSPVYEAMRAYVVGPLPPVLLADAANHMVNMPAYQVDYITSTKELVLRQLRVFIRNRAFVKSRLIMVLLMGFLYATTFYDVDPENAVVVLGVVFVAVLFLALGQVPLIPAAVQAREIFYKQRSAQFYRTSSFIIAQSFTQVPFAFGETLVFGSILYWGSGFVAEVSAFLIYLLLLFLTTLVYASWFFFLAMVAPNLHVSKPMAMVSVLIYVLFAGFVIFPHDIPDYFIWIYWVNPLSWCMRALAINQYSADEFQVPVYNHIEYMKLKGDTMGNVMLDTFGLKTNKIWILYGILFQLVCYFLFMGLAYLALEYKRYDNTDHSFVPTTDDETACAKDDDVYVAAPATPSASVVVTVESGRTAAIPVTLAFEDLWYSVPNPTKGEPDLKLLKGVSGYALPGTITALMGSSGAGKTTLMDVIAGRKTGGKIDGKILLNGYPATDLAIRRATGYCEQMDIHCCSATFREAFQFSAMLRQSDAIPAQEKLAFAEECLELLNLMPIADAIIRGSSVEQMKRLTIGVELAAAPSVLFLDEPTSGLDARSAKIIMSGIRKIASTGRTVVCTIHQPSKEVFEMFDSLLLLKRGGETVFFGDLGTKASHLIEYFSSIPNTPALELSANPATWMLEVIGAGVDAKHTDLPPNDYVQRYNDSTEHAALLSALATHTQPHATIPELSFKHKRAAASSTQCLYLIQRFFRMYWRTPSYNWTRTILSVFLAILFGLMYRGIDYTTYTGATGGVGMVFMTSLFVGLISFISVLPIAAEERESYYRERASQTYNALWYFIGTTLAEIPYVFGTTFLFTVIFYPFVGLHGSVGDCLFYGYNLSMLVLENVYLGQLMVYASPRVEVAALLGMLINAVFFLFMGYTPPASQIPNGYRWLYHITPLKYSVAILTAETFATCDAPDDLGCQVMTHVPQSLLHKMGVPAIRLKDFVEHVYEMKADDKAMNVWVVIGCIVLFRLLALLCLRYVNHQKR